jgi:predicted AlkP superfamily phosphohydrolase/phosphomutase
MIVGIDGGTLDLIIPWTTSGELPVLKRLIAEGVYGKLRSTPIHSSASAWTSFMTGKNPGKHGIFSFYRLIPKTYKIDIASGRQRDGKTLWTLLTEAGKRVGVINVPMTYPAESVLGFNIAGFPRPSLRDAHVSYPRELVDEIIETFGGYPTIPNIRGYVLKDDIDGATQELFGGLELRERISGFLRNKYSLDFFCEVITETDQAQHFFWHLTDVQHPRYDPIQVERHGDLILSLYKRVDRLLGNIIEELSEDWILMVMSDHGACLNHRGQSTVQGWLRNLGLLHVRQDPLYYPIPLAKRLTRCLYSLAKEFSPRVVKEVAKRFIPNLSPLVDDYLPGRASFDDIVWEKTEAFWLWELLWINLQGRQPKGIVARGAEYERLCDYIIEHLAQAKDYETGRPVIREAFKKEKVFKGKYLDEAPDIGILWDESGVISGMTSRKEGESECRVAFPRRDDIRTGEHSMYGTLILWGQGVKSGQVLSNAEIIDLAPTILHVMGQPIPSDMDGRVLTEAFHSGFLDHPIRYQEITGDSATGREETYSEDERREISERLKGLGYLGEDV